MKLKRIMFIVYGHVSPFLVLFTLLPLHLVDGEARGVFNSLSSMKGHSDIASYLVSFVTPALVVTLAFSILSIINLFKDDESLIERQYKIALRSSIFYALFTYFMGIYYHLHVLGYLSIIFPIGVGFSYELLDCFAFKTKEERDVKYTVGRCLILSMIIIFILLLLLARFRFEDYFINDPIYVTDYHVSKDYDSLVGKRTIKYYALAILLLLPIYFFTQLPKENKDEEDSSISTKNDNVKSSKKALFFITCLAGLLAFFDLVCFISLVLFDSCEIDGHHLPIKNVNGTSFMLMFLADALILISSILTFKYMFGSKKED